MDRAILRVGKRPTNRPGRRWYLTGAAALALAVGPPTLGCSATAPSADDLAVLFVGNSLTYSNELPELLALLLREADVGPVVVEAVAYPNYGLEDHWVEGSARERIKRGGWDIVVLQQGPSATEGRPSLLEYTRRFADEMTPTGARPALYMVWPSTARSFDFDGVADSYRTAAQEVGGLLFPVGEAWREAWVRDPAVALYGADGFHPTLLGSYLAALVMYEQITGSSVVGLPAEIRTPSARFPLEPGLASLLQDAAHAANQKYALLTPR